MKKIFAVLIALFISVFLIGSNPQKQKALADDVAVFSVTSDKTSYNVGDQVTVSLAVDAGPFSSTLNVIDFTLSFDSSKLGVANSSSPFTPGSIFSGAPIQAVEGSTVHAVVNVNPDSPPANRSGTIGTINFTATTEGDATFTYSDIKAAGSQNLDDYISTTASSLTIAIGSVTAQETSTSVAATSTRTSTPAKAARSASTGPEEAIIIAILAALGIMLVIRLSRKAVT
ncbi:hypothetical protein COT77_03395 [Candidatus Berkelbacteria bacterium CG10_big_fil_rev_8_21_14_0_10_41_12]|uniref:Cohesin domain-containing protein n=1 Tax=Candidatus Berkelbacteria bacterium CG10_big_fil_rev_8_21_14_0_10_41_12 TaxID=1974513 RepID=A0A2M6WWG3_9BACT|nr:MAG: hypothetical protein COT77_03395 [Candidatus Berkelbacteria bacterium CG10_big_fil_rev_8_21_14_0_10_41_12]